MKKRKGVNEDTMEKLMQHPKVTLLRCTSQKLELSPCQGQRRCTHSSILSPFSDVIGLAVFFLYFARICQGMGEHLNPLQCTAK